MRVQSLSRQWYFAIVDLFLDNSLHALLPRSGVHGAAFSWRRDMRVNVKGFVK